MEEGRAGATAEHDPRPQDAQAAEAEATPPPSATPTDDSPAASEEGESLSQEEPASDKAATSKQGDAPQAEGASEQQRIPAPLVLPPETSAENGHALTALDGPNMKHLLVDNVVATPEGTIHATVDMTSPSAAATHVAAEDAASEPSSLDQASGDTDTETNGDASELPAETEDGKKEGEANMGEEEDGSGEHATIKEVIESSETPEAPPTDEKVEQTLARLRDKLPCESAEMLESGEIVVLPKGWSTRQSKTNDGKTYYVSPYGHTQWLRPPMKTGVTYNWIHEIEVNFGPGRLGLNLKQIAGLPGTQFTDVQVHIAEIYKLPNGMASPAEIYNWSVKPEKRLQVGMRMTTMNGIPLTGYTYSEVLELLSRMARPVRIKFADVSKGIVGRVEEEPPEEETPEQIEARAARRMQSDLQLEYFRILVAHELHEQVWGVSKKRMMKKALEMNRKCDMLSSAIEEVRAYHDGLEKEREDLTLEAEQLREMIEQLRRQEAGEIESPEVIKSAELAARNAALDKEIAEIIVENEELRNERAVIEESLDEVQKELDEYADFDIENGEYEIKFFSQAFLGSMVQRGSIDTRAEDARERLLEKIKNQHTHLQEELKMEEERSKFVESEIAQIRKQMAVAAAASKREDDMISGHRPPQLVFLENKIGLLRKNLRETVTGIASAMSIGDTQQAENLSFRRAALKDDLKNALDEMQRMENELNLFSDINRGVTEYGPSILDEDAGIEAVDIDLAPHERLSESSRLQTKLTRLQAQLHDTVQQLAKAASEHNDARVEELRTRRVQLKNEMKVVQDKFQELTNQTLNVSAKQKDTYGRPSVSVNDLRASMGRPSLGRGSSEQFDMPRYSRSSSSASMASVPQSVDSYQPSVPVKEGSLPSISGLLLKHPTHSNEKGMFGNMSLRGVRERWCVIDPAGCLRYYKRKGDREPRGAIPLNIPSLEIVHGKEVGKPNEFMICSATHQTRMGAKNREDMLRWVAALELAHAEFMKQAPSRGSTDKKAPGHQESADSTGSGEIATSPASLEIANRVSRATLGF